MKDSNLQAYAMGASQYYDIAYYDGATWSAYARIYVNGTTETSRHVHSKAAYVAIERAHNALHVGVNPGRSPSTYYTSTALKPLIDQL